MSEEDDVKRIAAYAMFFGGILMLLTLSVVIVATVYFKELH